MHRLTSAEILKIGAARIANQQRLKRLKKRAIARFRRACAFGDCADAAVIAGKKIDNEARILERYAVKYIGRLQRNSSFHGASL